MSARLCLRSVLRHSVTEILRLEQSLILRGMAAHIHARHVYSRNASRRGCSMHHELLAACLTVPTAVNIMHAASSLRMSKT